MDLENEKSLGQLAVQGVKLALHCPLESEFAVFRAWFHEENTRKYLNYEEPFFEETDIGAIRGKFAQLPRVGVPLWGKMPTPPGTIKFLGKCRRQRQPSIVFSVVEIESKSLVGVVSLCHIDLTHQRADIRTIISQNCRGKGFVVEAKMLVLRFAFDFLGLHKVSSHVLERSTYDGNQGSLWANEKCGLRVEGKLVEHHLGLDGKWYNLVTMAILQKDWPAVLTRFVEEQNSK